jgi:hypothetical protein
MRLIDAEKLVDMLYDNEFAVLCPLDEVSGVVDALPHGGCSARGAVQRLREQLLRSGWSDMLIRHVP